MQNTNQNTGIIANLLTAFVSAIADEVLTRIGKTTSIDAEKIQALEKQNADLASQVQALGAKLQTLEESVDNIVQEQVESMVDDKIDEIDFEEIVARKIRNLTFTVTVE
jgi:hypothetical protein